MKKTQFAEKVRDLGYHVREYINDDLVGYMSVWKHGDYVCQINYRSSFNNGTYMTNYNIPDDIKILLKDYADL